MTSLLTRDAFMPSVPIDMPSLTVIVPNSKGVPPEVFTTLTDLRGQSGQVNIAGGNVAGQVGNPYERFVDVLSGQPHRIEI